MPSTWKKKKGTRTRRWRNLKSLQSKKEKKKTKRQNKTGGTTSKILYINFCPQDFKKLT